MEKSEKKEREQTHKKQNGESNYTSGRFIQFKE
jgi:hypothetical protein